MLLCVTLQIWDSVCDRQFTKLFDIDYGKSLMIDVTVRESQTLHHSIGAKDKPNSHLSQMLFLGSVHTVIQLGVNTLLYLNECITGFNKYLKA